MPQSRATSTGINQLSYAHFSPYARPATAVAIAAMRNADSTQYNAILIVSKQMADARLVAQARSIETLMGALSQCREDAKRAALDARIQVWHERSRAEHAETQLVTLQAHHRTLLDEYHALQKAAEGMRGEITRLNFKLSQSPQRSMSLLSARTEESQ